MIDLSSQPHSKNRYPGVKPFTEKENFLFFGRNKNIAQLKDLILIKPCVVLYGKSGYGKSSLINAGILPELRKTRTWNYFHIRFNNYSDKQETQNFSPTQTVIQRFSDNIKEDTDSEFKKLIPNHDIFWYWMKQNQLIHSNAQHILFFDQFEELFTYPAEQISEFSEQLSQLLYATIPSHLRDHLDDLDEKGAVSDELHDFLYRKPEIKIVFSIRADRLSLMNMLITRHPNILQNCYELDALSLEDAALAVIKPAQLTGADFKTPPFEYTEGAISKILEKIANPADNKIESSTLQIICRYVEETLVSEAGHRLITNEILGNITDIFQKYYEGILNRLPPEDKQKVQRLMEDELIDGDRRHPLSENYIINRFGLPQELLSELEQSSLLSKERDVSGRLLYEISHDTLIVPINNVAIERRNREEAYKTEREHTRQTEKRKKLEQQLQMETQRVNELKKRNIIATSLVVFCVIVMIIAYHSWNNAIRSKEQALLATYLANKATAQLYVEKGHGYFNDKVSRISKFKYARYAYKDALECMKDYKSDPLYIEIQKYIDTCDQKLK